MRGEPQKGLAVDISRIRRTIFGSTDGRPGLPFLDNFAQCSLNFLRLQATTVAGLTKNKASFQPDQIFEIQDHKILSIGLMTGLLSFLWYTSSWCRRATISIFIES